MSDDETVETAARTLWTFAMGGDTWADDDIDQEDRDRCREGAEEILAALDLPARDAAAEARGYARAVADLRAEAARVRDAPTPTMWAVFLAAADFLEARRG